MPDVLGVTAGQPITEAWGDSVASEINLLRPYAILNARGQIIRRGATAPEALALGAAGLVLRSNGTDPVWAAPDIADLAGLTARGQMIRRGAAAPEAFGLGAGGTFLRSNNTDPVWAVPDFPDLANYAAGNWTPTVTFGGASVGVTYNAATAGSYKRLGPTGLYLLTLFILLTAKGTSTGTALIGGLPFPTANANQIGGGPVTDYLRNGWYYIWLYERQAYAERLDATDMAGWRYRFGAAIRRKLYEYHLYTRVGNHLDGLARALAELDPGALAGMVITVMV